MTPHLTSSASASASPTPSISSLSATDRTPSLVSLSQDSRPSSDDGSQSSSPTIPHPHWEIRGEQSRNVEQEFFESGRAATTAARTTSTFYHPSAPSIAAVAVAATDPTAGRGREGRGSSPSSTHPAWPPPPFFLPVSVEPASLQRWVESQNRRQLLRQHHRQFATPAPPYSHSHSHSHSPSPSYSERPVSASAALFAEELIGVSPHAPVHPHQDQRPAIRRLPSEAELARSENTGPEARDELNTWSSSSSSSSYLRTYESQASRWRLVSAWLYRHLVSRRGRTMGGPRPDEERRSSLDRRSGQGFSAGKDAVEVQQGHHEKRCSESALPPSYETATAGPSSLMKFSLSAPATPSCPAWGMQARRQRRTRQYVRLAWVCFGLLMLSLIVFLALSFTSSR